MTSTISDGRQAILFGKGVIHQFLALDDKEVQVYGGNGKLIDPKDVRNRLKRPTAVFVSADGQQVDPFYLRLLREDALVVVSQRLATAEFVIIEKIGKPREEQIPLPKPEQIKGPPMISPADK
jgi:hypothetical protein